MKPPVSILAPLFVFLVFSCNTKNNTDQKLGNLIVRKDSLPATAQNTPARDMPDFHTNQTFVADTKTLKRERMHLLKSFSRAVSGAGSYYDTLVDINYDGYRDYIIGYYGGSGTGFKYRIMVYVYSKTKKNYFPDEQVSSLVNPSFFIAGHVITGFYIGLGGGWGRKLEWIKNRWILTKEFDVDNNGDSTIWEVNYPLKRKTERLKKPFQMIPPKDILESNDYFFR